MKKIAAILGGAVLLVSLTSCAQRGGVDENGNPAAETSVPATVVFKQPVPQGGSVTCVASKNGYAGGLSCDWVGYHLDNSNNE